MGCVLSIESDYSKYYYKESKKTKHKRARAKLSAIFFVLALVFVVSFFSYAFSNFLTIGQIVNIDKSYLTSGKILYAISLESFTSKSSAEKKQNEYKKQGASGVIYNYNVNEYKILSSLYSNKKDAEKVKQNLEENNLNAEIISLELLPLNLDINLTTKSREVFSNGVNLFYKNYEKLYNLSNKFDSGEIDLIKLKSDVNSLLENNNKVIENFNKTFNTSTHISALYVKIYLNRINKYLNNFLSLDDTANFFSEIKTTYFNIIFTYLNLQKDIV